MATENNSNRKLTKAEFIKEVNESMLENRRHASAYDLNSNGGFHRREASSFSNSNPWKRFM